MASNVKFYHFNTEEKLNETPMNESDIGFCKETRSIRTHDTDYGLFEWNEIPTVQVKDEMSLDNSRLDKAILK